MGWLLHFLGLDSASGPAYLAWSGALSDLGELTLIGGLAAVYRRHACHSKGCWRIGKYPVDGTPYTVCARCHPAVPDKGAPRTRIRALHRAARNR